MKEGWHSNAFQVMFQEKEEPKASISKVHLNEECVIPLKD